MLFSKSFSNPDVFFVDKGMEAGGFEPPSRDISGRASTCLVVNLKFARVYAKRQAYTFAISRLNSPLRRENPHRLSRSLAPLTDPQERVRRDGPLNLGSHLQLCVAK